MFPAFFFRLLTAILGAVICLPSTAIAQSQPRQWISLTYADRFLKAETTMIQHWKFLPASSFEQEMDRLELLANDHDDKGLAMEARLRRIEYASVLLNHDFSLIVQRLKAALEEAKAGDMPEFEQRIDFELGNNYFFRLHDYYHAFSHYLSTLNRLRTRRPGDEAYRKLLLVTMANAYYRMGDLRTAKQLLFEAAPLPQVVQKVTNFNNLNTLGLVYRQEGKADSAIYCFEQVQKMAKALGDSLWFGIASGNIGITHYLQGQFAQAIPLLQEDVEQCYHLPPFSFENGVNSQLVLADIYMQQGQYATAAAQLAEAEGNLGKTIDPLAHRCKLLPLLARLAAVQGQPARAYLLSDSALRLRDSLRNRDNLLQVKIAQQKADAAEHQFVIGQLQAERSYAVLLRNASLAGLLAVLALGFLFAHRQRLRHRMRQGEAQHKQLLAQTALDGAREQLALFTKNLHIKSALVEQSEAAVAQLTQELHQSRQSQTDQQILNRLQQATLITDEEWEQFKQLFEQVHSGFLRRLREKLPGLSPAETRYLALMKLNLNGKEMAAVLGVQPDSLRTYRHRLRRKLGLNEDQGLEQLVHSL